MNTLKKVTDDIKLDHSYEIPEELDISLNESIDSFHSKWKEEYQYNQHVLAILEKYPKDVQHNIQDSLYKILNEVYNHPINVMLNEVQIYNKIQNIADQAYFDGYKLRTKIMES